MNNKSNKIKILNSNENLINVIERKDLHKFIKSTTDIINKILFSGYGKNANNSLVIYEDVTNISIYTTDGIRKLKSLEFSSPIQNFIADQIRYIGEAVEKNARDGTTTAMLFASILLNKIIIYLDNLLKNELNNFSSQFINYIHLYISDILKYYLNDLLNFINKSRISIQDIKNSYGQEYLEECLDIIIKTSSREYYKDIHKEILKIFKIIPPIFYEYFIYRRNKLELDKLVYIENNEYEYVTNILLRYGYDYFNYNSKTEFRHNKCDLVILYQYNIYKIKEIEDFIRDSDNDYIIFLIKNSSIDEIKNFIKQYENKYNKKIIIIQYVNYNTHLLETGIELEGLIYGNKSQHYLVKDVNIKIDTKYLYISNIFNINKDDNITNNEYYNKDNIYFNRWVTELSNTINEIKSSNLRNNNKYSSEMLKDYMEVYRKIVIPKYPILVIGGKGLEHIELIDIIEDVLGSLSIIMKHGVLIDPYKSFLEYLSSIDITYNTFYEKNKKINKILKEINRNIKLFIKETFYTLYNKINFFDNTFQHIINYKTFEQTFIRSKDVLCKLIKTSEVIVPGTVTIYKNNKEN